MLDKKYHSTMASEVHSTAIARLCFCWGKGFHLAVIS